MQLPIYRAHEENLKWFAIIIFFGAIVTASLLYDTWTERRDAYHQCVGKQLGLGAHPQVAEALCRLEESKREGRK